MPRKSCQIMKKIVGNSLDYDITAEDVYQLNLVNILI